MSVRSATVEDAGQIAELCAELGYPAEAEEVCVRLGFIQSSADHAVFVAEEGTLVVGWVHVHLAPSLVRSSAAEVSGLVVREHRRGRGVGKKLMEQAEVWAAEHGCRVVRLRSGIARSQAHLFYERIGYITTKTQKCFNKGLQT